MPDATPPGQPERITRTDERLNTPEAVRLNNWCRETHGHEMQMNNEGLYVAYDEYRALRGEAEMLLARVRELEGSPPAGAGRPGVDAIQALTKRLERAIERAEGGHLNGADMYDALEEIEAHVAQLQQRITDLEARNG